jgi:hypothetical protein
MRALLLTVLLLMTPGAAWSQSLDDAPPIYVAGVYDRLANGGDYDPPDALYTPRLLALWEDMRKDAAGEVGRLDTEAGGAGGITVLRAVEAEEAAGQQGLGGVEEAPHGEAALAVAAGEQE